MGTRLAIALAGLVVGACGGSSAAPEATRDRVSGDISIFAAASLTEAFGELQPAFLKLHPQARLQFNFAGTPTLVAQIAQGAHADVLASADLPNMQRAVAAGLVSGAPQVFTRNRLAIAVQAGNPKHVGGLGDLARPGLVYIAAAPNVPAGQYAALALAKAGVRPSPRSFEADVKSVVAKVSLGEADAGIVYVTDIRAAGARVTGVDIPAAENVVAVYPVAQTAEAPNPAGGRAFIDFLFSGPAQRTLTRLGFTSL